MKQINQITNNLELESEREYCLDG